jgi:hypothetical protein
MNSYKSKSPRKCGSLSKHTKVLSVVNVRPNRVAFLAELRTPLNSHTSSLLPTMAQPPTTQLPCNEDNILVTISALKQGQFRSVRQAAATYNVTESTLRNRLARMLARRDCQPNSQKVTPPKEEVIVRCILDLDV